MFQNLKTFARVFRIRVSRANENFFDARRDERVRARRRAAVRATGFKRDVNGRALGIVTALLCITECRDFRVGTTRWGGPSAPDDFASFHQHRADRRVGRSRAVAAQREAQREAHELGVNHRGSILPQRHRGDREKTYFSEIVFLKEVGVGTARGAVPVAERSVRRRNGTLKKFRVHRRSFHPPLRSRRGRRSAASLPLQTSVNDLLTHFKSSVRSVSLW